jgi:hypothetical protein
LSVIHVRTVCRGSRAIRARRTDNVASGAAERPPVDGGSSGNPAHDDSREELEVCGEPVWTSVAQPTKRSKFQVRGPGLPAAQGGSAGRSSFDQQRRSMLSMSCRSWETFGSESAPNGDFRWLGWILVRRPLTGLGVVLAKKRHSGRIPRVSVGEEKHGAVRNRVAGNENSRTPSWLP